ncbi:hypothetical protein VF14_13655 [Nostoc linckia z18]|uniref:Uncharacterized protein n=2 Tax=Nostoc linckia TaxID=92942 RepID=A0A9Q6EL40_NOSLI|nr:hypothetical protein [Nostoc linckia]PHK42242.1 hypothetical protein VF12_03505 [Nostoc linckia z15]PHK45449.1 hypothetical protein VF13_15960 [Nostoc linckia z16]PHJ59026.1 hypothetical protein VF02_25940 [Nostoc linckia z1]PHJ61879.1 hypothetical protein VF05_27640 [Nostoc linckia z3]PHJ67796.1 hypothetical protein VF03_25390 [Nostoc linckia z2]
MSDGNLTPSEYAKILREMIHYGHVDERNHLITPSEYAKILREMIRNENDLTSHRLGWMSTFNAFLFGIVTFVWTQNNRTGIIFDNHTGIIVGTCIAGFLIDFSILLSLFASEQARRHLDKLWRKKKIPEDEIPPIWGAKATKWGKYCLLMPWVIMPVVFIFCWVILFFLALLNKGMN